MAIALKGITQNNATNNTVTLTKPTGGGAPATGDFLMLLMFSENNNNSEGFADNLSGWTRAYNEGNSTVDNYIAMYYRICDGTEASTINVSHIGTGQTNLGGYYSVWTGVDTTSPVNVVGSSTGTSSGTSISVSAVTTTVADCLAFIHWGFDGGDYSSLSLSGTGWPGSFDYNWGDGSTSGSGGGFVTKSITSAGTTQSATVSWSNADGAIGLQFALTPTQGNVPVNTSAPVLSGTQTVGSTLSVTNGSWTNSPTSYSYQWYSGGSPVSGATSSTYTIQSSDIGNVIYAAVTATNGDGDSSPANSNSTGTIPTNVVPTNTVSPVLSILTGDIHVGSRLSATTGTWDSAGDTPTYSYQWYSGGATVGSNQSTYDVQFTDIGNALYCAVTATNSIGASDPENTNTTDTVPISPYTGATFAYTNQTAANNLDITLPSGISSGDIIVIFCGNDDATNTAQWDNSTLKPTGFTLISEVGNATADVHVAAFYKIASGSEGGTTVNIPAQATADMWAAAITVTNVNGTSTIPDTSTYTASAALSSHTITGFTTTNNKMLVLYGGIADGSDTAPLTTSGTDFVQVVNIDDGTTGGTGVTGVWGYKEMFSGSAATGDVSIGLNSADGFVGIMFAIRLVNVLFTEVREKFFDNTGTEYANGTVIYCYTTTGSLDLTGAIGSITGYDTSANVTNAAAGEAVFTFNPSDTNQRFLVVDPSEDAYGLVTNMITPQAIEP